METKICASCKENKPTNEYYNKGKENRLCSYCKPCQNKYTMERWTQRKKDAILSMGGKCLDCGLKFDGNNHYLFDFHHLDPSKKDMNWVKTRLHNIERIKSELAKCVCVCSNCHRHMHYKLLVNTDGFEPST